MNRKLLVGGIAALIPAIGLTAQETPAVPAASESSKVSVTNLETHIAQREQRLAERGRDIVELDTRIEKRMDELVKTLAGLPETGDSADQATRLKKEAVQGLKRTIDAYSSKRREVATLAQAGDAAAESDLGKFDERITKRVDQIAELTKTLPADGVDEAYESEGGSFWNGYYYERSQLRGETEKKAGASDEAPEVVAKSLRKSLDLIDQRRSSLKQLLAKPKTTDAGKQLYTRELGRLAANEDHLQMRLRDAIVASLANGKPVGSDQTHDIAELIQDSRRDLREDVARLFLCYDQFVKDRSYVEYLKASLAAHKDSVEKNPPGEKRQDG